jgi:hypothetical protein
MVTTLAGSSRGNNDATGKDAQFDFLRGICWNPFDDCFYVCDNNNNAIRRVSIQGKLLLC